MNPASTRVVFMGSPPFAVPSLQALADAGHELVAVVTQPDRPAGRGGAIKPSPVKAAAALLGIQILQPLTLKDDATRSVLSALRPHLFVVAAYGKILPGALLAMPSRGALNVHASLLPRWRGPSPITAAILAGDASTGVTIMEMSAKMDAGPAIAQAAWALDPSATAGQVEPLLAALGARTLLEALPPWFDGQLAASPQDESLVTYCPFLRKEDGHLRATMTVAEAERAVRAYNPWPGAFVEYRGERLAIWAARTESGPAGAEGAPGALVLSGGLPAIAFADGLLALETVQRPGARSIAGRDFANGERGRLAPSVGLA
ncbi:MAG: methionyl-tRNA formyltransferase [Tepidiformaceae bacterium]